MVLSNYHRYYSHHDGYDDDREPTCESHASDELIREIHNEEWYGESEDTKGEPSDWQSDEPEYTSDNEIHESEYTSEDEERCCARCERHSIEISVVNESIDDNCRKEESEYESHSIWG